VGEVRGVKVGEVGEMGEVRRAMREVRDEERKVEGERCEV
jgi:hypothetical protein